MRRPSLVALALIVAFAMVWPSFAGNTTGGHGKNSSLASVTRTSPKGKR